eukprot:TRINITY_DN11655_c1_g1_i1.p1 TRINITY_DN11655_c1_g1~~TRINITY_DN11655_c1_g1_i1.p1  ORF type:complete len:529 (+),score=60.91 TRINITY_DN11655_c1_g1_i1:155-1741(+)
MAIILVRVAILLLWAVLITTKVVDDDKWADGCPGNSGCPNAVNTTGPAEILRERMLDEVKSMFYHGYNNYMHHAFPKDELRPITCTGINTLSNGGLYLTLIDSLDTLLALGNESEFCKQIGFLSENLDFNLDLNASVFETNIRVLGGLLTSHLLIEEEHAHCPSYSGELLEQAYDLGTRLLVAFNTPTGIPYGTVNLKFGIPPNESNITSLAGGGTFILEFGVLSALTGDPSFVEAALRSIKAFFDRRSDRDLLGNHIYILSGKWSHGDSGVGGSTDSFFEYLAKGYALFDDRSLLNKFKVLQQAISINIYSPPWYLGVNMDTGKVVWPIFSSLQAFYPGTLLNIGHYEEASTSLAAMHSVWRRFGSLPEGFNIMMNKAQPGQAAYPLRPELAESLWQAYRRSRDPIFIRMGADMVFSLNRRMKTSCGYCVLENVVTGELRDSMESFFLAETVKYLYLLFDDDNFLNTGDWIMNTESHPLPIKKEFADYYAARKITIPKKEVQCKKMDFWERVAVDGFKPPAGSNSAG